MLTPSLDCINVTRNDLCHLGVCKCTRMFCLHNDDSAWLQFPERVLSLNNITLSNIQYLTATSCQIWVVWSLAWDIGRSKKQPKYSAPKHWKTPTRTWRNSSSLGHRKGVDQGPRGPESEKTETAAQMTDKGYWGGMVLNLEDPYPQSRSIPYYIIVVLISIKELCGALVILDKILKHKNFKT